MTRFHSFLFAVTAAFVSTTLATTPTNSNGHDPDGYVYDNVPAYTELTTVWKTVTALYPSGGDNGGPAVMTSQYNSSGKPEGECASCRPVPIVQTMYKQDSLLLPPKPTITEAAGPTLVCRCDGPVGLKPETPLPVPATVIGYTPPRAYPSVSNNASTSNTSTGLPAAEIVQTMHSQDSLQKPDAPAPSCSCYTSYPTYYSPRIESTGTGLDQPIYSPKAPHLENPHPTLEAPQTTITIVPPSVHVERPAESLVGPGQENEEGSTPTMTVDATLFSPRTHVTQTGLDVPTELDVPTGVPDAGSTLVTSTSSPDSSGGRDTEEGSGQVSVTAVPQQTGSAGEKLAVSVFCLGAALMMLVAF